MTIPYERTRALIETKSFLLKLVDKEQLPPIPEAVCQHANYLLRHYPRIPILNLRTGRCQACAALCRLSSACKLKP